MPQVGNEGKLANHIFFHEKKHENESCASLTHGQDPALFRAGKIAPVNFRAGPCSVAPIPFKEPR